MMKPSDTISKRARAAMNLPLGQPDPDIARRALLEYIAENGPMRASEMNGYGPGHTPRLAWLNKEGYVQSGHDGARGAVWDVTALGRRWMRRVEGTPVAPRTRAFAGCVTESKDRVWADVRQGAMDACALQSRGME